MANAQPKSPAAAAPLPSRPSNPATDNTVDRLTTQLAASPTKMVTWAVSITVAVLAAWLISHFLTKGKQDKEAEFFDRMSKVGAEPELEDRARRLSSVLELAKGTEREPYVLIQQALIYRNAALEADDPADRIRLFEAGLEATKSLQALGSKAVLNTFLPAPPSPGGTPPQFIPAEMASYFQAQIDWLKANPGSIAESPDAGLTVTLTLTDPEGKEHNLDVQLFSKEAPQSVHAFLQMVNEGRFTGTRVFGLQQDDANTDENQAVLLGSALSAIAPDRPELWGGESDDVGFTIPLEPNRLATKKGRIAFERRMEKNNAVGSNPLAIVIFASDDAADHDRTIFGQVSGSDDLLAKLTALAADKEKTLSLGQARGFPPKVAWKIAKVAVTGTPANPDPGGFTRIYKAPEAPKAIEPIK